ncbi:MAG TPA: Calx-beta domain-containing protein [Pyrinomonadaceae bacterium]|nr:Calx-beta domain-containing protein [Pyrinomonadaceae bacterium]
MSTSPTRGRRPVSARRQLLAVVTVAIVIVPVLFALHAAAQRRQVPTPLPARVIGPPLDTGTGSVSLNTLGAAATENFDTLSNTAGSTTNTALPTGWYITEGGGGARDNEQYAVDTGGSTTGDTYSYGAAGSTERALGELRSGTLIPLFGAKFTNNTGATITSLNISYNGEQWRFGGVHSTVADRLDFQYSTNATDLSTGTYLDADALDFNPPVTAGTAGALNGNAAADRTAISSSITGLSIPAGATFFIRFNDVDATGADDGLAVDDFSITPQGASATPTPSLSIGDVTQAEGDSGTTNFNFTVSLSQPADVGGVTFTVNTADGTATAGSDYVAIVNGSGSITQGNTSTTVTVQVNGDTTIEANETFFVNISNVTGAGVTDAQGLGTITNDDVTLTGICQIQGSGTTSPVVGQSVTTRGIVTGIKVGSGFYIQDDSCDADPNTSNGVFVFTGATIPAAAVVGNQVQVGGKVQEFIPSADPNQKPSTEIAGSPTVSVLSTGNTLPTPIVITAADTQAPGLENLERFEGMRVQVNSLTAISGTQGTITENSATVSSNGVFYGVVTGVARPFREPGINISDPVPAPTPGATPPPNVPRFDENPERLRVDSNAEPGTTAVDISTGAVFTNVVGEMDYDFRTWTILPETTLTPATNSGATPVPTPRTDEFTVASFNMERFFDTVADGGESGAPTLTATAFANRLNKASLIVRTVQRYPDVIGVEEMENLSTLQQVAAKINSDAQTVDGLSNPNYQAYLVEGNDVGGIDVGFLVKTTSQLDGTPRVSVVDVTQVGKTTVFTNPDNSTALLNDRPPLVLRATVARSAALGGGSVPFTVIVNHLRSLTGVDDTTAGSNGWATEGDRVRNKRRAQAEFLANLIQSRQAADPTEKIITVGDMNAFRINDGYVDVIGTVLGTPAPPDQVVLPSSDLVNPDQTDLVDTLPPDQQYSYSFDGNAQVLDHVILNPPALAILDRFAYAREDADQPVKDYENGTIPDRISDHDQPVAYFSLTSTGQPQPTGSIVISEFRFRGPGPSAPPPVESPVAGGKFGVRAHPVSTSVGPNVSAAPTAQDNDEFIELYNNTDSDITVSTTDGSHGWALVASDAQVRFIIPNGTVIPARGHFLATNTGYSLSGYATPDTVLLPDGVTSVSAYETDIPDGSGIALFNTSNPANFTLAQRLDAAGYAAVDPLYREGAGFPAGGGETTSNLEYSFVRKMTRVTAGLPQDTGDNLSDFQIVNTTGASTGMGQLLGAPGPENLSSPVQRNGQFAGTLLDTSVSSSSPPNRVRDFNPDSGSPSVSQLGTLSIRRTFTNQTGSPVTQLRFRIIEVTSFPSPGAGTADLRAIDSSDVAATVNGNPVTVHGTTIEQPPAQPDGGAWNTTMNVGFVNLDAPLADGDSVSVQFLLGIQQTGNFRFFINVEAATGGVASAPIVGTPK